MDFFKPSPGFARLRAPLVGVAVVAALAVPAIYWAERSSLAVWSRQTERFIPERPTRDAFRLAGLKSPATTPAARANLVDDEPVIGIEVAGKFRAYHTRSMSVKSRHVLNDVLGGKAVTITYCDLNDCARAYGGNEASGPLDVALGGLDDGGMLLSVGDVAYYQKTAQVADPVRDKPVPPFPYASYPLTRTTWGEWKSRHPETDVYIYEAPASSASKTPGR
jgi:Protein of unknown function (DUF3179)